MDSRVRRDGAALEELGWYSPIAKAKESNFSLNEDRVIHWLKNGAQPTEIAHHLMKRAGLAFKWHLIQQGLDEKAIAKEMTKWEMKKEATGKKTAKEAKAAKKEAAVAAEPETTPEPEASEPVATEEAAEAENDETTETPAATLAPEASDGDKETAAPEAKEASDTTEESKAKAEEKTEG